MSKKEIIEIIKTKTEDFIFQSEKDAYVEGYLDALCKTYEISYDERYEIERELENEQNV